MIESCSYGSYNYAERQKIDEAFIRLQHVQHLDRAIEAVMMLLDLTNNEQEAMTDDTGKLTIAKSS